MTLVKHRNSICRDLLTGLLKYNINNFELRPPTPLRASAASAIYVRPPPTSNVLM